MNTDLKRGLPPLDKAGEKELYRQFILATPVDSYLRTVLTDSRDFIFNNMDADLAWPVQERVTIIDRAIEDSKAKLADVSRKICDAKEELNEVKREIRWRHQEFLDLVEKSRQFLESIDAERRAVNNAVQKVGTPR